MGKVPVTVGEPLRMPVEANDLFQTAAAQGNEDGKRALESDSKGISIDPGAGLRGLQ